MFGLRPFLAYQTDFFFKRATNVCTRSSVFANLGLSSMNVTVPKKKANGSYFFVFFA